MTRKLVLVVSTVALLSGAVPVQAQVPDPSYPFWCSDPLSCFIRLYKVLTWINDKFTPACVKTHTCPASSQGAGPVCEEPEFANSRMCQEGRQPLEAPPDGPFEGPLPPNEGPEPNVGNLNVLLDQPLPAVAIQIASGIRVPQNETPLATVCGWAAICLELYGGPKSAMAAVRGYRTYRSVAAFERAALQALRASTPANALVRGLEATRGGILFGQESVGHMFARGPFRGKTISEVAAGLRAGRISPDLLPLDVVVRNGHVITLNNRSLTALRRTGLAATRVIDRTGDPFFERLLDSHLRGASPSGMIRIRG